MSSRFWNYLTGTSSALPGKIRRRLAGWQERRRAMVRNAGRSTDAGMSTAEYAIGTLAACAFAALLYKVVTSSQILSLLTGLVTRALHAPF